MQEGNRNSIIVKQFYTVCSKYEKNINSNAAMNQTGLRLSYENTHIPAM